MNYFPAKAARTRMAVMAMACVPLASPAADLDTRESVQSLYGPQTACVVSRISSDRRIQTLRQEVDGLRAVIERLSLENTVMKERIRDDRYN